MQSLETQLATARAALASADKAHQDAALAAIEGGTEEAMQLKQARKAQEAAAAKVEALEAATVAADRREQERLAAEAAEVARMEQAALNAAIEEVRTAAAAWDAAFSALSASSDQLQEAARKMQGVPGPADVHSRVGERTTVALNIVEEGRRTLAGSVFFNGEPKLLDRMPGTID